VVEEIPPTTIIKSRGAKGDGGTLSMTIEEWAVSGKILDKGIRVQCPRCAEMGIADLRGASMVAAGGRPHIHCHRGHDLRMASTPPWGDDPGDGNGYFELGWGDGHGGGDEGDLDGLGSSSETFEGATNSEQASGASAEDDSGEGEQAEVENTNGDLHPDPPALAVVDGEGGSTTSFRTKEPVGGASSRSVSVHQRFLELEWETWFSAFVIAIQSAISTGKTTAISNVFKNVPILIIAHRRALCRSLARKFEAVNYEKKGIDWTNPPERLVICIDSLPKLMKGLVQFGPDGGVTLRKYTVIIDESERVLRHLHGRTLKNKHIAGRVWECLSTILCDHSDRIVLADAHLSDFSLQVVRLLIAPVVPLVMRVTNTWLVSESPGTTRRILNYRHPADLRHYLGEKVVEEGTYRPWIACDTKADAEEIHARLVKEQPGRRWILVTSVTVKTAVVKKALSDVNDPEHGLAAYDGVITSPSIDSGVDYNREVGDGAFDEVLLFVQGGRHTWMDIVQMVGRPRNLTTNTIRAAVSDYSLGRPTALWMLRNDAQTVARLARSYAGKWVERKLHPHGWHPRDARMVESDLLAELQLNEHGSHLRREWTAYWEQQGCVVEDAEALSPAERKPINAETTGTKRALEWNGCKATAGRPDIPFEDALQIAMTEASSPEEEQAATKALIAAFYNIDPSQIRAGHVWTDDRGRLRQKARNFGHAAMLAEGKRKTVMLGDHREMQELWEAECEHHGLRTAMRFLVLKAAGLDGIFSKARGLLDACRSLRWRPTPAQILRGGSTTSFRRQKDPGGAPSVPGLDAEFEIKLPEEFDSRMRAVAVPLRRLLGIKVESYLDPVGRRAANPMGIITKVLGQMGIKRRSKRSGSKPRRYFVAIGQVAGMMVLAEAWTRRYLDKAEGLDQGVDELLVYLEAVNAECEGGNDGTFTLIEMLGAS
jgi:hypothetical protein